MTADPSLALDASAMALRTGAAVLAGTLIGINRDLHHKSAGVRTHSLVSLGSALVMMVGFAVDGRNGEGATRVIQGLVTGIGFLGAGVILHRETKKRIEGLTTAASIWVAAAFGMACGAGLFTARRHHADRSAAGPRGRRPAREVARARVRAKGRQPEGTTRSGVVGIP